jgi:hypothetical protein
MAEIVFSAWAEDQLQYMDECRAEQLRGTVCLGEAVRRWLILDGEAAHEEAKREAGFTDADLETFYRINAGELPPRASVRLNRTERNTLKAQGNALPVKDRERPRLRYEQDFLMAESERRLLHYRELLEKYEPVYSADRRKRVRRMLEDFRKVSPDLADLIEREFFEPEREDPRCVIAAFEDDPEVVFELRQAIVHRLQRSFNHPVTDASFPYVPLTLTACRRRFLRAAELPSPGKKSDPRDGSMERALILFAMAVSDPNTEGTFCPECFPGREGKVARLTFEDALQDLLAPA